MKREVRSFWYPTWLAQPAALVEGSDHTRVIAIGECGLDYYYDKSDRNAQRERFQAHIEAARQIGLPLIVTRPLTGTRGRSGFTLQPTKHAQRPMSI